jgi:hypothetical protein
MAHDVLVLNIFMFEKFKNLQFIVLTWLYFFECQKWKETFLFKLLPGKRGTLVSTACDLKFIVITFLEIYSA